MNSAIENSMSQLAALQEIDRQRRDREERLAAARLEVETLEAELGRQRDLTREKQAARDTLEAKRRDLERFLEEEGDKMKDRRMRLNRVRNEKELQALRREIELGKEASQKAEEELIGVFDALEAASAACAEIEQGLTELQTRTESRVAEQKARIAEISGQIESDQDGRRLVAGALEPALLRKYEQIFQRRGGVAVVEVREGICTGCHINLPPQLYNELQRNATIHLCPSCHRILFRRPERLESEDVER